MSCSVLPFVLGLLPLAALAQQPLAHWSFDGATAAERLQESYGGGSLDASEVGGANSWGSHSGFGEVLANGNTVPYLSVPKQAAFDFGADSFSVSIWSYRSSKAGSSAGLVDLLKQDGTGFQLFYHNSDKIYLRLDDDEGNFVVVQSEHAALNLNNWVHLAAVVDREDDRAHLYANGVEVTPSGGVDISSLSGSINCDQDLEIGQFNGSTPAYGRLDDLAIFDRAFSAQDLADLNADGGTPVLDIWAVPIPLELIVNAPLGSLSAGDTIELSSPEPEVEFYYTLDGSEPGPGANSSSGSISLSNSGTLKALAIAADGRRSAVFEQSFFVRPATQPNILLVVADDIGFNDLQCYGSPVILSPALDSMAYEGIRFTQFTTHGGGDLASQYALLTGRLPQRSGLSPAPLGAGEDGMGAEEWTLAEALTRAGYQTAFVGEWKLGEGPGSCPQDQGFEFVYGLPRAIETAPPLLENGSEVEANPDQSTLVPALAQRGASWLEEYDPADGPFFLMVDLPGVATPGNSISGVHGNRVEAVDAGLGTLLEALDSNALADDTLVLFLSDGGANRDRNAGPLGSNGVFRDGAKTTWEGGLRAPCVLRWPGVAPQAQTNLATLGLVDLAATLVDLADGYQPADRSLDGIARPEALFGVRHRPRGDEQVVGVLAEGDSWSVATLRRGEWKLHRELVVIDPDNAEDTSLSRLYQLNEDPTEHINRQNTQGGVVRELEAAAAALEASFPAPGQAELPAPKAAIIGEVDQSLETLAGQRVLSLFFIRPLDSLSSDYPMEHSEDLLVWKSQELGPWISARSSSGGQESIAASVPLEGLAAGLDQYFLRFAPHRPANP